MFAMSEGREAPWPLKSSSCKGGVGGGSMGIVVGPCVLLAARKSPDRLLLIRRREGAAELLLAALEDRNCCLLLRVDRLLSELSGRKIGTWSSATSLSIDCETSGW